MAAIRTSYNSQMADIEVIGRGFSSPHCTASMYVLNIERADCEPEEVFGAIAQDFTEEGAIE